MKNKLTINKIPTYTNVIYSGEYNGHSFRIQDTNNEVFVTFLDHYQENDPTKFNLIKEEIKESYQKLKKNGKT